jgi:hypothetical protein
MPTIRMMIVQLMDGPVCAVEINVAEKSHQQAVNQYDLNVWH